MNPLLPLTAVAPSLLAWPAGWLALARLRTLPAPSSSTASAPTVSIVIPARNEAARLPALLASLRAQRHVDLRTVEIFVVDDASTDATAQCARDAGFTVLPAPERPSGWLGKSWACWTGAHAAHGDLLLFLDADVTLAPDALARLLAAHHAHGGVITVQPYHHAPRAYEQLSAFFNVAALAGIDAFTPWSTPGRPAGAFGPCLLVPRTAYDAAGGHAAVRNEIVEDVALAKALVRTGTPVHAFVGDGALSFRMYPEGPGQLVEGWTKNLARAFQLSGAVPSALLTVWLVGMVTTCTFAVYATLGVAPETAWAMLVCAALYAVQVAVLARRAGSFSRWVGLAYPLFAGFFLAILVRSLWHRNVRRAVTWRGRTIALRNG